MIFNPAHPGEILRDYLGEMTVADAASRLGVTRAHLSRILNGHAGITANTSLRLSAALGTSPDFWLKMQMNHDLWHEQKSASRLKIHPFPHVSSRNAPLAQPSASKNSHPRLKNSRDKLQTLTAAAGD